MALPKFSDLSASLQILLILALGGALWAVSEYLYLRPVSVSNDVKKAKADQLARDVAQVKPFEQKQKLLVEENRQLEIQLANLRKIVPDEKEVDGFIRLVEGAANASVVDVRRFTSKTAVPRDYYVEVPFEMEMDGPYYEVLDFYDRLGKLARIINVSDLKLGSIESGKSIGNKPYSYKPNETVAAICTITTFFSREEEAPPETKPGQPAKPPEKK